MNKSAIVIIDDDNEDLEIKKQAFEELNIENEIIAFNNGAEFLEFAKSGHKQTLFTICDVNMSPVNGIELRKIIQDDDELRLKCVPFIFFSTSRGSNEIMKAYSFGVQGYFIKPNSIGEIKEMLLSIINYWKYSQRPSL